MPQSDVGVVYLMTGPRVAERLLVSLASLRRHYDGPVSILTSRDEALTRKIAFPHQAETMVFQDAGNFRHATYVTKTLLPELTPYKLTIYIDADTLVLADPRGMPAETPLTITQFSTWQSQGRIIGSRIRQWLEVSKMARRLAELQEKKSYPAVNTGVMAFRRGWKWAATWKELCHAGRKCSFTDELGMQLLTSQMSKSDYTMLDSAWNSSPIYPVDGVEPKIYHFHGSKHIRKPAGCKIWWPEFVKVWEANLAGVRDWAGKYGDKDVAAKLEELKVAA